MIKIDKIDDGLPISVIVPLSKKREKFFYEYVYPLLEINNPNEIIINSDNGSAPKKRNDGFKKSTQPFIFFCDDDIIIPSNYLKILYEKIIKLNDNFGYVYTGYNGIVLNNSSNPNKNNFILKSEKFNIEKLQKYNYISTMSLIKRNCFPFFDEKLKRFQDWDLYLTLLKNNIFGKFIPDLKFMAFYLDNGITSVDNNAHQSYNILKNKHNI